MKTIGEFLREKRKECGLSSRDIWESTGISYGYITRIERDESNPTLEVLARLLKALDVEWDEFLLATGYMKPRKKGNEKKPTYDLADDETPTRAQEKPSRYKPR
ncbi:MAG: helix-turn-helix transcriptional regulator [Deltaproteobacteria bacterium]|nr:helix-turn-helix transcriptional regulator [Deltaproteobacteria bacterium]